MPEVINELKKLQFLKLSFNKLSSFPEVIGKLENLQSLGLSNNQLSSVSEVTGELKNLQSLDLRGNQLSSVSEVIGKLENLQLLDLRSNQLSSFPEVIGKLKKLQLLDLSNNQLSRISKVIGKLENLQSLDLSNNQLSSVPEVIGKLENLQSLDLRGNQLSSVPEVIGKLKKLQSLDLSNNQLSNVPEVIGKLEKLQSLGLSNNQLSSVPEVVGKLKTLQSLDLSNNQPSSVSEVIGELGNLQSLNLSNNQLSSVPEVIGELENLQSLNLSNNQLSSVPEVIGKLKTLQSLNLWDNKISHLPNWSRKLEILDKLDLRANRLPIPPEVLGSKDQYDNPETAGAVIDYYFQEKSDAPLYEAKLIIVGEGGAGKTTLAKKLINPEYELKEDERSTEGIEVIPYEFDHPDGHRCKVNIWDFGGQEIYHATHQFFLTERAVYALVTDSRQGNTDFYFWLNVIQLHGADSPVLLIKNEKGDRPCSVPDMQLRGQFNNLKESLETNLETNRNLEGIKTTLEQYITNLSHVGDPLPKTWAQVRSVLENQALGSDNYISLQDYRQICTTQGITNREEQDRLSRFLHQLGVFLHFQDIDRLAKTIFLTPAWSTDAVYKVLDTPKVRKNYGRFNKDDLQEIWSDSQYADVRGELLALMQEFEVSYEIIGFKNHYIAPHLLEDNLPKELEYIWDKQDNLILSYHYPFKPKNIFPRFIVALHRYIENQTLVWKHGVVLSIGSARAEVIEDIRYESANIRIRINGIDKKRLLSIIGHELDRIHTSFNDLKYETRIPCNCSECKSSQTPYQFSYRVLQNSLAKRNFQMQCQQSFQMVNVRRLIDDVVDPASTVQPPSVVSPHNEPRLSQDSPFSNKVDISVNFPAQTYQEQTQTTDMSTTINQFGSGDNVAGDQIGRDKIGTQNNNASAPASPKAEPNTAATTIFLSYARQDGALAAQRLRTELISAGFTVWQDTQDMQGGKEWKAQLRNILKQVDTVLVLMTPAAVASKYVEWEWDTAQSFEKTVIPIKISECDVPDELQRLHYRDLSTQANYSNTLMTIVRDLQQSKPS